MESASGLFACIWGGLSALYWQNDDYRPSWRDVPAGSRVSTYGPIYIPLRGRPEFLRDLRHSTIHSHVAPKNANTVLRLEEQ